MPSRQESVSFAVSLNEKRALYQAAAAADESVSSFVRQKALDGVATADDDAFDGRMPPLEDFKTARLTADETADPVPKAEVYDRYVAFCRSVYPEHEIETQHKVSREIAAMPGVETGRVYVSLDETNPQRKRCFKNLRLTTALD